MKRTFLSTLIGVLILWFSAGHASAQLTFGLVPDKNSLIQSEDDAKVLTAYLEDRLDEKIYIELIKNESELVRKIENDKIDLAVVSSLTFRKYWKSIQVLANYTRTETKTHKLLLLSSKSGSIHSIKDVRKGKHTLVLDEKSGSRFSFLTKTLKADPKDVFYSIQTSAQMVDTLSGLINGTYDVACIEDGLLETVRRFDPGLVDGLRVIESSGPLASDPIVTKKPFDPSVRKMIQEIFLNMESDSDGQQILLSLKISKFVPPITEVSYYIKEVNPAQYRRSRHREKVKTVETAPVKVETPVEPEAPKELPEETPKAAQEKREITRLDDAAVRHEPVDTLPAVTQEAEKKTPLHIEPATRQPFDLQEKIKTLQGNMSRMKILWMVVPAVLGLLFLLVILPWIFGKKKKVEPASAEEETAVGNVQGKESAVFAGNGAPDKSMDGAPVSAERGVENTTSPVSSSINEREAEASDQSLVELRGELKTIKIPELLQLMASCNNTGALTIQSHHEEKCLYFRDGKICSASCLDKDNKNKLGNILVKIGKVTESERERALELCSENPSLRLGNALLQIGAVDKTDLLEALRVQAEEIVYSLFLFPEGRFEFQEIEPRVNPDEDLALDVMSLLMEGARREDEWRNMREAIPSMDVVPVLIDQGQENLHNAGLTEDQQLILTLIDGQRSIRDICLRSPLVDFEVCDLIYRLMRLSIVKCGINAKNDEKKLKFGS